MQGGVLGSVMVEDVGRTDLGIFSSHHGFD